MYQCLNTTSLNQQCSNKNIFYFEIKLLHDPDVAFFIGSMAETPVVETGSAGFFRLRAAEFPTGMA